MIASSTALSVLTLGEAAVATLSGCLAEVEAFPASAPCLLNQSANASTNVYEVPLVLHLVPGFFSAEPDLSDDVAVEL